MAICQLNVSQCYSESTVHYETSQIKDLKLAINCRDNCIPEQHLMMHLATLPHVSYTCMNMFSFLLLNEVVVFKAIRKNTNCLSQ